MTLEVRQLKGLRAKLAVDFATGDGVRGGVNMTSRQIPEDLTRRDWFPLSSQQDAFSKDCLPEA